MRRKFKYLCLPALMITLWTATPIVQGATIWCNPQNSDNENGFSKSTGYKTLHKALAVMASGDMVKIANGDWRRSPGMFIDGRHVPPDGKNGNYSKVWAETDFAVKLPYIYIMSKRTYGYLEFRGIVFDNRYIGLGKFHICYDMHHTKFVRCGFLAHGLKGNMHTCGFGSADSSRSKNQFNLMEECIAWGSGRYVFYCKYGKYNIFRRCIARHDFNDAQQMFNFRSYACDYTVYQNCISIDSDRTEYYVKPINVETGGFWLGDQYGTTGNIVDGCISIKDIQMAYYIGGLHSRLGSALVKNCIALDMTHKVPKSNTLCAFAALVDGNIKVLNFTGVGAKLQGHDGIYCKKGGKKYIENCIIRDVNDEGVGINISSDSVTIRNVVHYNVGGGKYGRGSKRIDPFKNGLIYPVRIEENSALATLGRNGTVCGATILKKIGVSGTLHGEAGWDKVTEENLWPFPNETKIRELMRETVNGVSGLYGFCAEGQTLSNYIWGYFGNTVPPFNVSASPGNGKVTLTWDPPADVAIETITGFNVYELSGKTRKLVEGTVPKNTNYSKTIAGLHNGSTYEFAVTTIDKEKGESGVSYKVRVTPKKLFKMPARQGAHVEANKDEKSTEPLKLAVTKEFIKKRGMVFAFIPPGSFERGIVSDEEDKVNNTMPHKVTLTKGFYMQTTEVTQGQWKRIMGKNPSFFKKCGDDCPVEQVSWMEVQQFIKRLNQLEGTRKYRLPTEAEWEYACRAGTQTPFSFGECLTSQAANYNGEHPYFQCARGIYRKMPISAKNSPPNLWGLIGMHGNVWEWCQDWFGNYSPDTAVDPSGPPSGSLRVIRGGGWNSYAGACRSGNRSANEPTRRFANLGFRVARDH